MSVHGHRVKLNEKTHDRGEKWYVSEAIFVYISYYSYINTNILRTYFTHSKLWLENCVIFFLSSSSLLSFRFGCWRYILIQQNHIYTETHSCCCLFLAMLIVAYIVTLFNLSLFSLFFSLLFRLFCSCNLIGLSRLICTIHTNNTHMNDTTKI